MRSLLPSVLLTSLLAAPAAAGNARFVGIGDLPGGTYGSQGCMVTDSGIVYGEANGPDGTEAVLWTEAGGLVPLGDLPGGLYVSHAWSGAEDGSIAAGFSDTPLGEEAMVWTSAAGMQRLADLVLPSVFTRFVQVRGGSSDGRFAVGWGETPGGTEPFRVDLATGAVTALGTFGLGGAPTSAHAVSDDGSVVVGEADGIAMVWTEAGGLEAIGDFGGGQGPSRAKGLSPDGSLVVGTAYNGAAQEAFLWSRAGGMQGLGELPGGDAFSQGQDISADGRVVVGMSSTGSPDAPLGLEAMYWTPGSGMRRLKDVLADFSVPMDGWTPWLAIDLSDDGRLVTGIAIDPNGDSEGFFAVVPRGDCNNGLDDDGDGAIDLADPGCRDAAYPIESPRCQNGADDDGDGRVDFDGGASIWGSAIAEADPQCNGIAWGGRERPKCGLGAELGALAALVARRRRRR